VTPRRSPPPTLLLSPSSSFSGGSPEPPCARSGRFGFLLPTCRFPLFPVHLSRPFVIRLALLEVSTRPFFLFVRPPSMFQSFSPNGFTKICNGLLISSSVVCWFIPRMPLFWKTPLGHSVIWSRLPETPSCLYLLCTFLSFSFSFPSFARQYVSERW